VAGRVADVTGSFGPTLLGLAALLGLTTIATALFLRTPTRHEAQSTDIAAAPASPSM
jgi:hypothetical protein